MQRDEVVGGDRGACVVERPILLGERERLEPEQPRELEADLPSPVRLGRDGRGRAVELLRPSRRAEALKRVETEAPCVRVERRERCRSARVRYPLRRVQGQSLDNGWDRRVRYAQKHHLGAVARLDSTLLEAREDGRADPAGADHVHAFDHRWLQFRDGYRAGAV